MFRWCSYCQNLIGEAEPLNDLRISHGICSVCSQDRSLISSAPRLLRARSIAEMLDNAGRGGSLEECERVINEALEFGLKPSDLIVGILTPSLYEVGELWERGEVSVAQEHRFTAFALSLIDRLSLPEPLADRPLIILATHPKSLHDVGVRILQLVSWEHGIPCERFIVGTSEEVLLEAASTRRPVMFGLSVSLAETIPDAVTLAESFVSRLPPGSKVVLGGLAFRRAESYSVPKAITVIRRLDEYLMELQSIRSDFAALRQ